MHCIILHVASYRRLNGWTKQTKQWWRTTGVCFRAVLRSTSESVQLQKRNLLAVRITKTRPSATLIGTEMLPSRYPLSCLKTSHVLQTEIGKSLKHKHMSSTKCVLGVEYECIGFLYYTACHQLHAVQAMPGGRTKGRHQECWGEEKPPLPPTILVLALSLFTCTAYLANAECCPTPNLGVPLQQGIGNKLSDLQSTGCITANEEFPLVCLSIRMLQLSSALHSQKRKKQNQGTRLGVVMRPPATLLLLISPFS